MKINIFKHDGKQLFDNLERYNYLIQKAYDIYEPLCSAKSTWWFNPKEWKLQECVERCTQRLLRRNQLVHDAQYYNMCLYPPNYLAILLINKFYPTQKDILIEDACAGDGRFFVFLSKCDYTNFSAIEDFSQVSKCLFDGMMASNGLKYVLNNLDTAPIVVNQAGYPVYPKKSIPDSVELICIYGNQSLEHFITSKLLQDRYIELCTDYNDITIAWCRNDKYDEFKNKIKQYEN